MSFTQYATINIQVSRDSEFTFFASNVWIGGWVFIAYVTSKGNNKTKRELNIFWSSFNTESTPIAIKAYLMSASFSSSESVPAVVVVPLFCLVLFGLFDSRECKDCVALKIFCWFRSLVASSCDFLVSSGLVDLKPIRTSRWFLVTVPSFSTRTIPLKLMESKRKQQIDLIHIFQW